MKPGPRTGLRGPTRVVLPEKLLTVREVAERLGVCRATVYAMVERGRLAVAHGPWTGARLQQPSPSAAMACAASAARR